VVGLTPGCHSQHQRYLGNRYLDLSHWLYRHLDQLQCLPGPRQRVALHTPCSVRFPVQGTNVWQQLLQKVSGPEWLLLSDSLSCCGAGGAYRFDQPKRSAALGAQMAQAILGKTPDLVLSANVGCLQQISSHLRSASIPVEHPAVFLARHLKRSK
jgi:glycolate oxidase iron-sulfur subunit